MTSKFIRVIDPQSFYELIKTATQRIFVSLPNIHEEFAESILTAKAHVRDIRITIDVSESNYRNGYGNINAVEKLKQNGVAIFECSKNRISFVICDEEAYFIFPESRIFAYDDIGSNAVKMDPLTQVHLIEYFFPNPVEKNQDQKEKIKHKVTDAAKVYIKFFEETIDDLESEKNIINVTPIDGQKLIEIKKKLKKNPPTHPDLERQIQIYTTKIQFVEMVFEGANLHIKKIKIPPTAMPFKDEEIKKVLETKMKLFAGLENNEKFIDFFSLKDEIETIRKKYCVPITSRKKSLIKISEKEEFKTKIIELQNKIKNINKAMPESLDAEILASKQRIKNEMRTFLNSNPPEEIKNYDPNFLGKKIEDIVSKILNSIKYPDPHKIVTNISLNENFYDLTFEDFKNKGFLEELQKKGIMEKGEIEKIVSVKKAFETKS